MEIPMRPTSRCRRPYIYSRRIMNVPAQDVGEEDCVHKSLSLYICMQTNLNNIVTCTLLAMLVTPKFPVVVKIGHAHSGLGKIKVENHYDFQDVASVVAVTNCYSTTEQFIDGKYDIHVQKIGSNWKANTGSAMLEQIQMNDRFKFWVDEVSQMFGGLDILAVEGIQGKDGREYVIEVNDSSMGLLGESQEEDRRLIADLVCQKIEVYCRPVQSTISKTTSAGALMHYAMNGEKQSTSPVPPQPSRTAPQGPNPTPRMDSMGRAEPVGRSDATSMSGPMGSASGPTPAPRTTRPNQMSRPNAPDK
ncbi:hypothetical protein LSH36_181g02013 [Paralvinella palmiformis]|uniref:Synapsin ATP-binding domain-containing protein n=1 Tax=Paralvinella palmiformis TaxID=53620 RepID=A0AAD9JS64_9ANNE|nr:hypothetical protein LSH36_181g02013 [Paralvinella palmiformis]